FLVSGEIPRAARLSRCRDACLALNCFPLVGSKLFRPGAALSSAGVMPPSATEAMARAVPTDVVQRIVSGHVRRAPTPSGPQGLVDTLLELSPPEWLGKFITT